MKKSVLDGLSLSRRQVIGLSGGVAAAMMLGTIGTAFAGLGGSSGVAVGGGQGSYYGLPWIEWYDSKDGVEQGHTVDSNMRFWANRVMSDLESGAGTGANRLQWRGFAFQDKDLRTPRGSAISANESMFIATFKQAMDRALARNGSGSTYEDAHVRVVGVSCIMPMVTDGYQNSYYETPDWVAGQCPFTTGSKHEWSAYMSFTDMYTRPALDGADTGVGVLKSSVGWSEDLITQMMDTYITDGDLGYQANGYVLAVWAVSDADFGINVKVSKKSGTPLLANDMSGAQYTIYKDAACTQIAKLDNGSNAVLTVGEGNVTPTVTITRSEGFAHTGGSFKLYVKETKAPTNGMFELDPIVHEITMESNATVTVESTVTTVNSVDEVKPAQIAVRKRTANISYTKNNKNYDLSAVFEVRESSASGKVVATITTDSATGNSEWVDIDAKADGTKLVVIEKKPAKGHDTAGPWEMTVKPGDKKYVNG